ncbi:hypothetical protein IWQ56_006360 [Coemansia nantahalensis]|nr:hypothetical protein IWQ56_006360 [Coemansia nantahalensis]
MASLRSQVESERQAASASSVYRDFAGTGHADAGHWNDPPTVVFKPHNKQPKAPKAAGQEPPSPSASPFMIVDRAVTPNGTAIAEVTAAGGPPGAAAASLVSLPDDPREQAEVLQRALRRAVASVDVDTASPMVARMVEDTRKRLQVLDERLPDLSPQLTAAVCAIALLVDQGLLAAATDAHRDLMQAGYDSELKWLVGIKRVIELRQKAT